jgi:hypothetical protein
MASRACLTSCSVVDVVAGHPDDRTIEQPAALQPVQRAEGHPPGQVAGDAEDDQQVRAILHQASVFRFRLSRPSARAGRHTSSSDRTTRSAPALASSLVSPRRQVAPGDVRVQQVKQGEVRLGDIGIEPRLPQEQVGVLGGGRGGDRYAGRLGREDETDRVGEGCELPGFDQRNQVFLLDRGEEFGPASGVGYAEVLERRAGAGQPRPSGDDLLIHGLGELLRSVAGPAADVGPFGAHQLLQRIAPRAVVR